MEGRWLFLRSNRFIWNVVPVVFWAVFLAYFYGGILVHPNEVLLAEGGDGLKNYFTYAWHAEHDKEWLHYAGSNYPHGEHVFFTDGHPLAAWILQALPFLVPWKIGVLNVSIIVGLAICGLCMAALFRRLGLPPWAAAFGAIGITILQPQLQRMGGHLSLSHCWLFPLTWYLLLRIREGERWLLWTLVLFLVVSACFFIHPYTGLMSVLFICGYHVLLFLFRTRTVLRQHKTYWVPVLSAGLPILFFLALLNASDVATDRPTGSMGADIYATRFLSLIVATQPPFSTPLTEFFKYDKLEWESFCYLGSSSLLMLVVIGGKQVSLWVNRTTVRHQQDDLPLYLGSAFLVLLFAMGEWQELFGTYIPMLSQFRGTGRFAWVFYYVCATFCTARLYQYLFIGENTRTWAAVAAFASVVSFYGVEGWAYHVDNSRNIGHGVNVLDGPAPDPLEELIQQAERSGAKAILPLPFFHGGSERYEGDAPEGIHTMALIFAYHTGLPLMAGITSRTSLQSTRDLLALTAPSAFPKRISRSIPPDTPIILLRSNDPLDHDEERTWQTGGPIYANAAGAIRIIPARQLFASSVDSLMRHYIDGNSAMHRYRTWKLEAARESTLQDPFPTVYAAADLMPIRGVVRDHTRLMELPAGALDTSLTYEASFVFRAIDPDAVNIWFVLELQPHSGFDGSWAELRNIRSMPIQFVDSTVTTMVFRPDRTDVAYRFLLKGPDESKGRYEVTNVLVRPLTINAWQLTPAKGGGDRVSFNNIPLGVIPESAGSP